MRILNVFGTRPEAIKMAPVIHALISTSDLECTVCNTAQHREMLDQVLQIFDVSVDYDLDIMRSGQDLAHVTESVLKGVMAVIAANKPDRILVHGDTTTAFAAALAGFYQKIPVGHVESGLRTGRRFAPFPEEINRKLTDTLCDLHFAPTQLAANNLACEGVSGEGVFITGNTVVDALLYIMDKIEREQSLRDSMAAKFGFLTGKRKIILVTGHRRENFGVGFENICHALAELGTRDDVDIVYPVHLNPNVQAPINRLLEQAPNVHLLPPLDYLPFVYLMSRAHFIITDSGGIQEEAPSLGKPVLVMRDVTERPEAVEAGTIKLVGTDRNSILSNAYALLDNDTLYATMSLAHNPYGDGRAANRIIEGIRDYHGLR